MIAGTGYKPYSSLPLNLEPPELVLSPNWRLRTPAPAELDYRMDGDQSPSHSILPKTNQPGMDS